MNSVSTSTNAGNMRNKKGSEVSETDSEEPAVPDSTTCSLEKEKLDFAYGQDVLVKHKDGRYYLGTVVEVDTIREQCLVKFGDNTESWSCTRDVTKLSLPEEDLLCVVCKKSAPKEKNEITVCDKCGRGYHQKCHHPEIPVECMKEGANWMCRKCIDVQQGRLRSIGDMNKAMRKESIRKVCSGVDTTMLPPTDKTKLPYDPDLLNWDTYHRVNMEQIYCYCGRNGEWYTQMVQCGRCKQWFHEKCVRCLRYPLYCGDRFYVFVCSICNYGKEFVRRLELKWVDVVHLMLFNLTAFNVKKYYDLDTVIIPYINDNWHTLQLPPKIYNISKSERREHILSALTNNRNRFKCGREIKKRTTIWGLRVRLPPPAPCATLPPDICITEAELKERWQGNRRLQFLPAPRPDDIIPVQSEAIMMGTAYQNASTPSETESPCPSPVGENDEPKLLFENNFKLYKMDYHGGGFVKKSVPFPKISLQRRKRLLSLNVRERDKLLRRQMRSSRCSEPGQSDPKELKIKKARRLLKNAIANKTVKTEVLPLTPPTSVSGPPTPPPVLPLQVNLEIRDFASASLVQDLNAINAKARLTRSNLTKNNLNVVTESNNVELNTPCDTSGDETSSKSTLDLIIPPPKNFEGKNNPFHNILRTSPVATPKRTTNGVPPITLPLPLTAVIPSGPIVRPFKRQLSEKDICIGPNGEVKRRRFRRNRAAQLAVYAASGQPTASKTATIVPMRSDGKEWGQRCLRSSFQQAAGTSQIDNCVDYALNGRRLRQRQDKSQPDVKAKSPSTSVSPKTSPIKQEPDINMDDLKTSVNQYFGAANRIAAGERFNIKAKRTTPAGVVQYLIEWEGPSGMT